MAGKTEKGKEIFSGSGFKILTEVGILEYIRKNANRFADILSLDEIHKYLNIFEGFFTYFSGFNQNRENYYVTKDEKATAVATRIVHENLPIFCDNVLIFRGRQRVYEDIFESLKKLGDPLVMKGKDKKETPCISIDPNLFRIEYFTECLSQTEIESYNEAVGNANFLINRYNQAQGEKGAKLKFFKTLYKQIGCGKRDALFFELTDEKKADADKKRATDKSKKKFYSLEELFYDASEAGKKYFRASGMDVSDIGTASSGLLMDLVAYIRSQENFAGFYWSKSAMNTISNRYFSDWHSLKDRLKKEEKVFQKPEKGSDEDVKIPEAIELDKLFSVLDPTLEEIEGNWNWRDAGVFFKESLTEKVTCAQENKSEFEQCEWRRKKNERYALIIQKAESPSRALLEMILSDIEEHAKSFVGGAESIVHLSEYRSDASKDAIKSWLDEMLSATQMIKYFVVRPGKIKGASLDAVLAEYLKVFLDSEKDETNWFRYYDATRNFLTKKPQDDAKKNKLKLNFGQSTLASGWDMNKESDNLCVIFRDRDEKYFLGIISKRKEKGYNSLFKKQKENKLYVVEKGEIFSKMEYKLLPGPNKMLPKCLLPKSNRKKYGATDEILKIYDHGDFKKGSDGFSRESLGKIIDFYKSGLQKYEEWNCFDFSFRPTEEYVDISQFYLDVEKQGYKNSFVSVNKTVVDSWVSEGKLYLFEIHNQDSNSGKKEGHKNNLHTMYWDAMFRDIENRPKLNGEAEVFYRSALPEEKQQRADDNSGKSI
ncbi:MAG: type V CRISPR-associated protein Cas12a/Cpf1, partial [Candidatus Moraniibacteriota bacterium]